jgi:hypothetical protein
MLGECPAPQEGCKYAELRGCFSDTDHIVPQRLGTTALNAAYIDLPVNKQQLCRREHDAKTAAGDEPLPAVGEMREAVVLAHAAGQLAMGRRRMKAVYGRDWKDYYNRAIELRRELNGESSSTEMRTVWRPQQIQTS